MFYWQGDTCNSDWFSQIRQTVGGGVLNSGAQSSIIFWQKLIPDHI
ncbi:hypothetical protein OF870_02240 [Escherichia coli]|nr:hypothetical protein [Escherichia coli]UZQ12044.1 hypothetical protein OF870_02240 [Escherichia coli]